jgi:molybdate transport system regulatory protein
VEVPGEAAGIMRLAYKVWLDQGGKVFGEGPCELLGRVDDTKSLRQAALQMGMSYSKAWSLMRRLEKKIGFQVLRRKVGGKAGGGSELTPAGRLLMERYKDFSADVREAVARIYSEHFGSFEREVRRVTKEVAARQR